jgi:NAD(P)-dependent dehydrogenase (short-subunit alcohol dehydrogenase family)
MDPEDQKMHEIPYKDVITAYGVNAFVPFVLFRELLPLMRSSVRSYKPTDYTIYLSACEGQPETYPHTKGPGTMSIQTCMAKAALNMLAETEAAVAWRESKIAMNSVNPDYAVLIRSGWRCREEKARSARSARRMGWKGAMGCR